MIVHSFPTGRPFARERAAAMVRKLKEAQETVRQLLAELEALGVKAAMCPHPGEQWDPRNARWLCALCGQPIQDIECFTCHGSGRFKLGQPQPPPKQEAKTA